MDIRSQSALLAGITGLALGIAMLLRRERARALTLYGVFAISVGAFQFAHFFEQLFPLEENTNLGRVAMGLTIVFGSFVPSTALTFFVEFLSFSVRAARLGRRMALISVLVGIAVGATPLASFLYARVAVTVWIMLALSFSLSLVVVRRRSSDSSIERLRLLYLAIGGGLALLFTGLDFLARFQIEFPSLGAIVSTLYLFLLSQTLLTLRLMDLHELLGKVASQTVLASLFAAVFLLLTFWWQQNVSLYIFNTVIAAFVLLILFEPLATKVQERVTAIFFRQRFAFLESLRSLQRKTGMLIDPQVFANVLLDGLYETRRVTHASVYLLADDRPGFRLFECRGPPPVSFVDAGSARVLLGRTERAQMRETIERRLVSLKLHLPDARRHRDEVRVLNEVKQAMLSMRAGMTVPLMGSERVLGFLNVWDERVFEAFASDEIALMLELADRLAGVLENSKLYDKMRERDRLAALGEMAAGLAHEIRNPLGAIKGAAQYLDPSHMPKDDREFIEVIVDEVNRLNGVVTAFLDYSRPLKQNFGSTDLNEVVQRTLKLIHNEMPKHVTLTSQLSASIPRIDGDAEQLRQVLLNLIQNAVQAISDRPGTIVVQTRIPDRFSEFRGSETVELIVSDNGPGIPNDQQTNIFVPFYTTKQKGTGLGLAICQRIVKNHGGSIILSSKPNEGTTFIMRLPALASDSAPPTQTGNPDKTPPPELAAVRERRKKRSRA
jgi:two-component system, NtrC family, sensor histidine kinase HydH